MCFEIVSQGVYTYKDVTYHEVDCGGGGNCLFLSLAYLLRFYNIDAAATHQKVREYAADIFENWLTFDMPDWADGHGYEVPDVEEAYDMGRNGYWGTKTAVLAIVTHYANINVTILGPEEDDVYHVDNLTSDDPRTRIFLFYSGYNHYRALIPHASINLVPDGMRIDKGVERKISSTLFASLKTTSISSLFTNTSSSSTKSYLEIHHIDVGQGDCTLIYVKDEFKSIVKSILIDTGEKYGFIKSEPESSSIGPENFEFGTVGKYLETMINYGDFRPIDILIMSHWDKDHMGAAAELIKAEKYTQKNLRIIDLGDPEDEDEDAATFLKTYRKHPGRELPTLNKPLVDDCLGFTLTCYMFNGLVMSAKGEDYVTCWQHWKEFPKTTFFPTPEEGMSKRITFARNQYFPPVKDKNNRSIALAINFHGFTYFTAGDLSGEFESAVAETIQRNFGHCCAWKLGHHGAGEASTPKTLQHLQPRFGVVSCGTDNGYGHPSGAAIDHLAGLNKSVPCDYYVTTKIPAQASGKKFQPGQITGISYAKDSQGHIILFVNSTDKHRFEIISNSNPKGKEFKCGERKFDESFKIEKSKKRAFRLTTDEDDEEATERRNKRMGKFLKGVMKALKNHAKVDDSWLDDEKVKKAIATLAGRIRRDYGEECFDWQITNNVNSKVDRSVITNADELAKALLRTN